MSKIVVYSCVTGNYDKLHAGILNSQVIEEENAKYILFTDNVAEAKRFANLHNVLWDVRPLVWQHPLCKRRTARWHKLNSTVLFPGTDHTVWFDGSQRIKQVRIVEQLVKPVMKGVSIAAFKHPDRTCVYQELEACKKLKKDNPTLMDQQIHKYRSEGYPPFNGMVETACVIRGNNTEVVRFNKLWWEQLQNHSFRDQLSFNYVAWKLNTKYGHIPGHRARSPFCDFVMHGRG